MCANAREQPRSDVGGGGGGEKGGHDSVPASVWKRQVPSLLTMLGRALGQPVALLGERR